MKQKTECITYLKVFLGGVLLYLAAVLPFLIYRGGIFFYYGDYNVQQVPFYILAHRAVRSRHLFWNPGIDLGSSFLGSFAFYLSGSPFFWISTLFPEKVIPYLLPFLMAAKYGTAMTAAFAWMKTITRTERGAYIGALLYAFSGFSACNIVFQHFHEAIAFFPLYLLSFDRFVQKKGRMSFVFMTAFMSILNYFFFFGQVIFIVLYYLVRYVRRSGRHFSDWIKETGLLLLHGALGLGIAAFFLIQIVDAVAGNTRLGSMLLGYDMLAYSEPTTPLAILKSMFMVPDIVGRGTLFTSEQIRNSSLSAYLPAFGIAGVIAFFRMRKDGQRHSWIHPLLIICCVTAFVPILNSVFAAFNDEYYARWFYMPILFMSAATAMCLENGEIRGLRAGLKTDAAAVLILIAAALLPSKDDDGNVVFFRIMEYPTLFVMEAVVTVILLLLFIIIVYILPMAGEARIWAEELPEEEDEESALPDDTAQKRSKTALFSLLIKRSGASAANLATRSTAVLTALACLLSTAGVLLQGSSLISQGGCTKWRSQMLDNHPDLPDTSPFYRIDTDGTSTNYDMVWGIPSVHSFQSTVDPAIFSFYKGIGVDRTVDSKMDFNRIGARAILSVRYYMENDLVSSDKSYDDKGGLAGYVDAGTSDGFIIHENTHYIPMGFTFNRYMTEDTYALMGDGNAADRVLVRDIVLSSEDAQRYGHLLTQDSAVEDDAMSLTDFYNECDERASSACTSFAFTGSGFRAETDLPKENLVFFSVPDNPGFTAYVDGVKTDIIKADFGLIAVDVPAGVHQITFTFVPRGFVPACAVSAVSLTIAIVLCIVQKRRRDRGYGRS